MKVIAIVNKKPVTCIASRPRINQIEVDGEEIAVSKDNVMAPWSVTSPSGSIAYGDTVMEAVDNLRN